MTRDTVRAAGADAGTEIVLGVRPEQFAVLSPEDLETPALELVVEAVEDTGAVAYLHTSAKIGPEVVPVVVRLPGRPTQDKGAQLRVTARPDAVHCFSAETGLRIDTTDGSTPIHVRFPEDAGSRPR
ncbi:TOBE domain-containing protein [Streptomyces sp. CME 23]|nr:TOBE domain-containing protein [Streptomyces sp. CME 23]